MKFSKFIKMHTQIHNDKNVKTNYNEIWYNYIDDYFYFSDILL